MLPSSTVICVIWLVWMWACFWRTVCSAHKLELKICVCHQRHGLGGAKGLALHHPCVRYRRVAGLSGAVLPYRSLWEGPGVFLPPVAHLWIQPSRPLADGISCLWEHSQEISGSPQTISYNSWSLSVWWVCDFTRYNPFHFGKLSLILSELTSHYSPFLIFSFPGDFLN